MAMVDKIQTLADLSLNKSAQKILEILVGSSTSYSPLFYLYQRDTIYLQNPSKIQKEKKKQREETRKGNKKRKKKGKEEEKKKKNQLPITKHLAIFHLHLIFLNR